VKLLFDPSSSIFLFSTVYLATNRVEIATSLSNHRARALVAL